MRFASKQQLCNASEEQWQALWDLIDSIPPAHKALQPFSGTGRAGDLTVRDVLAHLYAWHRLMLGWMKSGPKGKPALPMTGYNWRQTPELNQHLFEKYQDLDYAAVRLRLKRSHGQVMKLIQSLSEKTLLTPGKYEWTGKLPLSSYFGPNTVSHYRWAIKKIKQIRKTHAI